LPQLLISPAAISTAGVGGEVVVTVGAAVEAGVAEAGFTVAGVRADGVCEG